MKHIINNLKDFHYSKIVTLLDYEIRISDYLKTIKISPSTDENILVDTGLCAGLNQYRFICVHLDQNGKINLNNYKYVTVSEDILEIANNIICNQQTFLNNSVLSSTQKIELKKINKGVVKLMENTLLGKKVLQEKSPAHIDFIREKVAFYGAENSSLQDLIALVVGKDNMALSTYLSSLSIREIYDISIADLMSFEGIGVRTAERIYAAINLAKKLQSQVLPDYYLIKSPEDIYNYPGTRVLFQEPREVLKVLFLNTKNCIIGEKVIFKGTINASIVHPREIFKEAIDRRATSVVILHNHPSGDPGISKEDIEVTKKLVYAGDMTGIKVLDHIIVGDNKYVSLKERGYIE